MTLELLRDFARGRAEASEALLERLRSGAIDELFFDVRLSAMSIGPRFETITIRRGDQADYVRGTPSFEDLMSRHIASTEAEARRARQLEARAMSRIAIWAPAELRPI